MGWDNPPVPWREFERRLSWGKGTGQAQDSPGAGLDEGRGTGLPHGEADALRPVTRLPVGPSSPRLGRAALPFVLQLPGRGVEPV